MSIEVVRNLNLKNHIAELKNTSVKMAVSYIKRSGVDIILKEMNSTVTEVLLSADRHMSDPEGLKELLKNGAKVGILSEPRFHAKIYIFTSKNDVKENTVIIGSSNLSESGWKNNDEGNVIIKDNSMIKEVESIFEQLKSKCIWIKNENDKIFNNWVKIFTKSEENKQIDRKNNENEIIKIKKDLVKKQLIKEIIKQFKNANYEMINKKTCNFKTGFLKFRNKKDRNFRLISVHLPGYEKYGEKIPMTLNSETYKEMLKLSNNSWIIFVNATIKAKYMAKFNDKILKISPKESLSQPSYKYHRFYLYKNKKYQKLDIQKLLV